jgi:serine/threonine-protein kinase
MPAPIERVRRARRHDEPERLSITTLAATRRPRASSLAVTSPFRKPQKRPSCEQFGPYIVYEQLGHGGMAVVHRAELAGADGFRKSVALKRMRTELTEDPDFVDSFVHEAQLVSLLRHPNIAQAFDLGKIGGTYYIAMELVPGPTLAQVMAQSRRAAGLVPLPIVLEILIQLCDALEHAHELHDEAGRPLDLIHRDVSPGNVIVASSGVVKLIDFGIAKARSSRLSTQVGVIKGKHAYLAPEYTYGQLDRRADLFGLGVIAHELLTGRRLFLGETELETIRNVREKPIHPPSRYQPQITRELDDIILTALQRDPERRWQNAGAMRVALTAVVRQLGLVVSGRQIRDWAEWAFEQPTRKDIGIGELLENLDPSISISIGKPGARGEPPIDHVIEALIDDPRDVSAPAERETRPARDPSPSPIAASLRPARPPNVYATRPAPIIVPVHVHPSARPPRTAQGSNPRIPAPRTALGTSPPIAPASPRPGAPMFATIAQRSPRTSRSLVFLFVIVLAFAAVQLGWIDAGWWFEHCRDVFTA